MDIDERITRIETKLVYLEDFSEKLQEVILEQGEILRVLKRESVMIKTKITEIRDSLEDMPDRRPPHY
ncbi:MAG: SlyX family protein [Spirochaetaceae bacterium]|jgi:SlyX protein|nr:SlyX family protein [Spirochaetaceae bacterium]